MNRIPLKHIGVLLAFLVLWLLAPATGHACFGPKLFIGVDETAGQQAFYALVSIYLKEKTGTESTKVPSKGSTPADLLGADGADLVFVDQEASGGRVVFRKAGLPTILSGERPLNDLQFTLVLPALQKLSGLLEREDLSSLASAVASGAPPLASARDFLDQRGWL